MSTHQSSSEKAAEAARTKAQEAREKTEQTAGQVQGKAEEMTGQARQKTEQMAGCAREKAEQTAGQAREKAAEMGSQARDFVDELGDRATAYASEAIGGARAAVDDELEHEQERAGGFLNALGDAIDAGCESLRDDGYRGTAGLIRPVSRVVRSFANDVDRVNPQDYTRQAENFVRDNPMIAMGALAIAGFAFAALLQRDR